MMGITDTAENNSGPLFFFLLLLLLLLLLLFVLLAVQLSHTDTVENNSGSIVGGLVSLEISQKQYQLSPTSVVLHTAFTPKWHC
jgi:hypothetical protein